MVVVGTHTSIAKGPELAFERSAEVGGETLQIFAKSPRGWKHPTYTDEQYAAGVEARKKYKQKGGLVHSSYLVNLSQPGNEIPHVIDSVVHDFEVASEMGYDAVNVHVGKLKGFDNTHDPMSNMRDNVQRILEKVAKKGYDDVQFLFENTAGQGTEIGKNLEELSEFYNNYLEDLPVKFCLDTAHCQGGGIDVRKWDEFVVEFEEHIGIEQLYSIHLNDSKAIVGSFLDRHASLGHGFIGLPALSKVITWAAEHDRKLYIETPEPKRWSQEVDMVRQIANGDVDWIPDFHEENYQTQYLKKFADLVEGEQEGLF